MEEQPAASFQPGEPLQGFWEPDGAWYPCTFLKFLKRDGRPRVQWEDGSVSNLNEDEVSRKRRRTPKPSAPLSLAPRATLPPHRYVLAPMVGGSELPFRMMARRFGAELCYSPMIYSGPFAADASYRDDPEMGLYTCKKDRPLVAHFCGNDPDVLLQAAKHVVDKVDAVDLNLGCPQRVAHSEHFGAYLLDPKDRELVCSIVKRLSSSLPLPVFCKIRLLDELDDTLRLVKQLEASGASLIAVHARYRGTPTHRRDGPAHLEQVAAIKKVVAIPVLANGNVRTWADVTANLASTGADGIMSAEGMLDDPCLFSQSGEAQPPKDGLGKARCYLEMCRKHHVPPMHTLLFHCRRMAKEQLTRMQLLEEMLSSKDVDAASAVLARAEGYRDHPETFVFDREKLQQDKELERQKAYELACRKKFEERMARKAKREGKTLTELLRGTAVPGGSLSFGAEPSWLLEKEDTEALPSRQRGKGKGKGWWR